MNYNNMPLVNSLLNYINNNYTVFHMPGHKQGYSFPQELKELAFNMDLTELDQTDNLFNPKGAILQAQERLSSAYKSKKSFFLTNGSSCGIQAMIMAVCSPGDKIIVDRNCHSSVINGLTISGADPIYIYPEFIEDLNIWGGINPEKLDNCLRENPQVNAVLITYPTYYGICSDIRQISKVVHEQGKILLVDQAHGAHFAFSNLLPECSVNAGADICVQSAHKTLPALTQSAYLHVGSTDIDIERLKEAIKMFNSSSPSYILMVFLDYARGVMEETGRILYKSLIKKIDIIRNEINNNSRIYCVGKELINKYSIKDLDTTRLIFNLNNIGLNGYNGEKILKKQFGIQVEMSDIYNIVCIMLTGNSNEEINSLKIGILGLEETEYCSSLDTSKLSEKSLQVLTPKEVFLAKKTDVQFEKAQGCICASTVGVFPPGVPVICPGEEITESAIDYILITQKLGGSIVGLDKGMVKVVVK